MKKLDLDYLLDENSDEKKVVNLIQRHGPLSEFAIQFLFFKENRHPRYNFIFLGYNGGVSSKKVSATIKEVRNSFKIHFDHYSKKFIVDGDTPEMVDDRALLFELMKMRDIYLFREGCLVDY